MAFKTSLLRVFSQFLTLISPTLNTKFKYYHCFKKKIRLDNPVTLDEKILWLKLNTYYQNQLVTDCADKYKVREYLKQCNCEEILNTLYYSWDSVDEIDWDKLPQQFVIKWNFGCGKNLIVRDKKNLNIPDTIKLLKKWQKESKTFYLEYSEMQYKDIVPKLICEKLIQTADNSLPTDYKIYCFNGQAKYVLLCIGRAEGKPHFYFFDRNMKLHKFNKSSLDLDDNFTIPKPEGFEKLFDYAEKLSKPFPFVRADFYLENGKITFGELTFTPSGGMDPGRLPKTNEFFGSLVNLPKA